MEIKSFSYVITKNFKKKLSDDYSGETDYLNIDFRTISKLAYDKTGIFDDYKGLSNWLSRCIQRQVGFGYKHVIVDEGQDFGVIDINAHQDREKEGMENWRLRAHLWVKSSPTPCLF